jgi:O-antigen/teichoic acid export membrane protein
MRQRLFFGRRRPSIGLSLKLGRVARRRVLTAGGIYLSVLLGFLGTVVATHDFSPRVFGLFSIVVVSTSFFQALLDLTVEEAAVKYGFRFATQEQWGKFRSLFVRTLQFKVAGAALAAVALVILAPLSKTLFGDARLEVPLLVAAAIPLGQSLEGLGATALFLRSRYDVRSGFLVVSMVLRLVAIAVGAPHGLTACIVALVCAQLVATSAVCAVGLAAFRRFPAAPAEPLAEQRREIVSFVLQSSAATGVMALRGGLTPLLLGVATTPVQVGYYRVAQTPQTAFAALSAPARMILLTEQTRDWERGRERDVVRGIGRYSLGAAAMMAVATPVLVWLMPTLIRWIYGAKYLGATDASRVLVFAAAVLFVVGWTKSFPVTIGKPHLRIVTHGIETIVLLPLVVVLGAMYGATGAAIAVLAAAVTFAVLWLVLFLRVRNDVLAPGPEPVPS